MTVLMLSCWLACHLERSMIKALKSAETTKSAKYGEFYYVIRQYNYLKLPILKNFVDFFYTAPETSCSPVLLLD
jgi:hypothetical protein